MTFRAAFYTGTQKGTAGLFNRIVRWWDTTDKSHMELFFDDGVSWSSSFSGGGVRSKKIAYNPSKWVFVDIDPSKQEAATLWFEAHKGCKYDCMAILRFWLGPLRQNKRRFMCAEACMSALGYEEAWRFSPASAYQILTEAERVRKI